jgi:HD-GYP domain-containing protein (c-di-GMP phosphodiesterase class II)
MAVKQATRAEGAFVPIAVETLLPSQTLSFDLFVRQAAGGHALYREKHIPLEPADLQRLLERDVHTLFIHFDARAAYAEYLRGALVGNEDIDPVQRFKLLQAATQSVFVDAFNGGKIEKLLAGVQDISDQIVRTVCSERTVMRQLFSLMVHDYCTYTHANNVSSYCVSIAWSLGIRSQTELAAIAAGGLLHDIGKRHLSVPLLNKVRKLTQKETAEIRRHPQLGFQDLCRIKEVSFRQLMMVYQHHERLNGSGYPVRVGGNEIDPWARICAVADVFDAMTAQRSYQQAKTIDESLDYLQQNVDSHFDREAVQCLADQMSTS